MSGGQDRGQVVALAFVLAVGLAVVGLAVTQAFVVPQQNAQTEFEHSGTVQEDMESLRTSIVQAAQGREQFPASISLGTQYKARTLLQNPSEPSGSLMIERYERPVDISNVQAVDREARDVWNGGRSYQVASIVYKPDYNEYGKAPTTVYEHSVAANQFPNGNVRPLSGQELVDGDDISLVLVDGELERTQSQKVTIRPTAMSRSSDRMAVQNKADEPITIRLPTRLDEQTWKSLLEDELVANGGNVESLEVNDGELMLKLQPGTYDLGITAVGFANGGVTTDGQFVTLGDGDGSTVSEGGTQQVTFVVRDAYNNPVSGATLTVEQPETGYVTPGTPGSDPPATTEDTAVSVTSDEDGRATVTYHAPLNIDGSITPDGDGGVAVIGQLDGTSGDAGEASASLAVRDTSAPVDGTWQRPMLTGVAPSPEGEICTLADGFMTGLDCPAQSPDDAVRVYFPEGYNAEATWTLGVTDESGTVVETALDPSNVNEDGLLLVDASDLFDDGLPDSVDLNDGAQIELRRGDTVVDEFAYTAPGSSDGPTTSDGWNRALGDDEVAYRVTDDGTFADANRSSDWKVVDVNADNGDHSLTLTGGGSRVPEGESESLRLSVVDEHDFPVYGAEPEIDQPQTGYVTAGGSGGSKVRPTTDVTGDATVTYGAPFNSIDGFDAAADSPAAITATLTDGGDTETETATLGLTDTPAPADGDWSRPMMTAVDPSPDADLCALDGSVLSGLDCSTETDDSDVTACDIGDDENVVRVSGSNQGSIDTERSVIIEAEATQNGRIKSGGDVCIGAGARVNGGITADGSVTVKQNAEVNGKIKADKVDVAPGATVGAGALGYSVRLYFPEGYNADATWTLVVNPDEGSAETETLTPADASEDGMLLVNAAGLFNDGLPDEGATLELRRDSTVVDEFAYGSDSDGPITSNGWNTTLSDNEVAYRATDDGTFADTNRSADWNVTDAESDTGSDDGDDSEEDKPKDGLPCGINADDALVVPDEHGGNGAIKVKNGKLEGGDSVVIRDEATQNGKITTNGGDVCIGEDATVNGGITADGGTVTLKSGATVNGTVTAEAVEQADDATINPEGSEPDASGKGDENPGKGDENPGKGDENPGKGGGP